MAVSRALPGGYGVVGCGGNLDCHGFEELAIEFYVGLHRPSAAQHFDRCMVSVNRLRDRRSDFAVGRWVLDSGAFTEIATHGHYRTEVGDYAEQVNRWARCGELVAAVSQDLMCESWILEKTGMSVLEHQALTIERYDALLPLVERTYVMPVLQGYEPMEYVQHIRDYGDRLRHRSWVGVGSVCKRNSSPDAIANVLLAIKTERPDLRLHGFGVKRTALTDPRVRALLFSADSMAWSFAARKAGRDANCWREADRYRIDVERSWAGSTQPMLDVA